MASASPIKFPSANWSVPLTLSAMDLGMSSGWAASFVAEVCGVPDFPIAERAMPHMTKRVATRKRLILASVFRKGYVSHGGKSNERALRSDGSEGIELIKALQQTTSSPLITCARHLA